MSGIWLWRGIHLVLAFSLPVVLALLVGCKKIEEEKADYGPEVAPEAVDQALAKAIRDANFDGIRVGQYIDYSLNRRLENEEFTILLGTSRVEVIDRKDTETQAEFTLKVTQSVRTDNAGNFETVVTTEPLILNKTSLVEATSSPTRALEAKTVRATAERKVRNITYHRLREYSEPAQVPLKARQRPDCGGLSPCSLPTNYIQFDMVQWYEDGGSQKISLDFGFSPTTPFLPFGPDGSFDQLSGLMTMDCRSMYVQLESRTVFVRDCQNLEDFQK